MATTTITATITFSPTIGDPVGVKLIAALNSAIDDVLTRNGVVAIPYTKTNVAA